MAEGWHFATLAALLGQRNAARWGNRRVTIGAVGTKDGERFVVGQCADGTVALGEPADFSVPVRTKPKRKDK